MKSTTQPAVRLVTYNIHKGIGGVDRKYRPERIVEVLAPCRADFIFLQEVDDGVPRSRAHRQVELFSEALDMPHHAWGPNVRLRKGCYGNAILSRHPFDHSENIDLTIRPKKARGALHARLNLPLEDGEHRRLWLFNAHLGLSGQERRAQLRHLLTWLRHHRVSRDTGVVLGGDLNDVFGRLGPVVLQPEGFRGVARPAATFPAARPLRALDRVFVRGPLALHRCYPSRLELARQASDHLPLISILRLT